MKLKSTMLYISLFASMLFACAENTTIDPEDEIAEIETDPEVEEQVPETDSLKISSIKILALGDSYTIGQSVCQTCRYPEQLKRQLEITFKLADSVKLQVIARTGWTTTNLINAIKTSAPAEDHDLVTLLIGVNNQYQSRAFSIYQAEFPQLVNTAIQKAKGDKSNIIVLSIPDYAYTPFGGGNSNISTEIDAYNAFAEDYCLENNISYANITDITREGLANPALVASDGLHPSELAYSKFVDSILPIAIEKIKN